MLFRCNILALVGGGAHPKYPEDKVMLWDDHQQKCIGELGFKSKVVGVHLRKDKIVVILPGKIYVYNFVDLKLIDAWETTLLNPKGICAFAPTEDAIFAYPDTKPGVLKIRNCDTSKEISVQAHESDIAYISISSNGKYIATASKKGTIIRIFDASKGNKIKELRRGADNVNIISISFNATNTLLACSSDKGTVHVFHLPTELHNHKSALSLLGKLGMDYFGSEWSFAQFRIPDIISYCCFGPEDSILIGIVLNSNHNGR